MGACCAALHARLRRPGDSEEDEAHRRQLFTVMCWAGGISLLALIFFPDPGTYSAGLVILIAAAIGGLLHIVCRAGGSYALVATCYALCSAIGVLLLDIYTAASMSTRMWPFVVLIMDLLMVMNIGLRVQFAVICGSLTTLAVVAVERIVRFGLYDLVNPSAEIYGACDCATPPCKVPVVDATLAWCMFVTVFLLDFGVTRGFAVGLRAQQCIVEAAIRVSEQAAVRLSQYEVDQAKAVIDGSEGALLPQGLRDAYALLCENLVSYKAYLPQSCLPGAEELDSQDEYPQGIDDEAPADLERSTEAMLEASRVTAKSGAMFPCSLSVVSGSAVSSAGESGPAGAAPRNQWCFLGAKTTEPRSKSVSLLAANSRDFLGQVASMGADYTAEILDSNVTAFVAQVKQDKGNVDLLSGDHFFASFDAARRCPGHRMAAVQCAWRMRKLGGDAEQGSIAVCSGQALCGDFGSSDTKRLMTIGGLHCALLLLDRFAAKRGIEVLIDHKVHQDASTTWHCRLVERVRHAKHGGPFSIWSVISEPRDVSCGEWMYQMEARERNPFEKYNTIFMHILKGEHWAAASALAAHLQSDDIVIDHDASEVTQLLRERICEDREGVASHLLMHELHLELEEGSGPAEQTA
eukprot:TRINITY_DN51552_c0_g1_i1.p1 TRINITY_DN51552_c0_g1~~TRINITY_DN51552_c0_g1_i1.p1  ORF type:complete len:665 (+),score=100.41 TRINITY_DN51552_c0_g1_i1:92-1996(+)